MAALDNPDMLDEYREQVEMISETSAAPLNERFDYANTLAGSFSSDRESVRQKVYLWQRWWRDVLLTREGVTRHVQNPQLQDRLQQQAASSDSREVAAFLRTTHETLAALDANANPRLALEAMMLAVPNGRIS